MGELVFYPTARGWEAREAGGRVFAILNEIIGWHINLQCGHPIRRTYVWTHWGGTTLLETMQNTCMIYSYYGHKEGVDALFDGADEVMVSKILARKECTE